MDCSKSRKVAGSLAGALLVLTAAASLAPAATLDQQTCDQLKREVTLLEGMGVRDNISKGAAWGKANLRSQQLEQVKKLIEMDEAVAFRCPRPKPVPDPAAGPVKGKAVAKAGAKAGEQRTAQDIVKPKPKPRPKPTAAAEGAPAAGGTAPATASAAPQPKPKPKPAPPKATDAYTPPPKAPPAQ